MTLQDFLAGLVVEADESLAGATSAPLRVTHRRATLAGFVEATHSAVRSAPGPHRHGTEDAVSAALMSFALHKLSVGVDAVMIGQRAAMLGAALAGNEEKTVLAGVRGAFPFARADRMLGAAKGAVASPRRQVSAWLKPGLQSLLASCGPGQIGLVALQGLRSASEAELLTRWPQALAEDLSLVLEGPVSTVEAAVEWLARRLDPARLSLRRFEQLPTRAWCIYDG